MISIISEGAAPMQLIPTTRIRAWWTPDRDGDSKHRDSSDSIVNKCSVIIACMSGTPILH